MARVTSKDVARAAGVSQTTVSFVLNGRNASISAKTKELVLATAQRLGYIPSAAGRALAAGRSDVIACITPPGTASEAVENLKHALSAAFEVAGFTCVFLYRGGSSGALAKVWQHVDPASVIAFDSLSQRDIDDLDNTGVPFLTGLVMNGVPSPRSFDQSRIGELQVRHLAERGHHRIGYVARNSFEPQSLVEARIAGAQRACSELGLAELLLVRTADEQAGAEVALRELQEGAVTAVAAFNDTAAIAILAACSSAGVGVPSELAVCGVDDIEVAALVTPPLTSIAMELTTFAERVAADVITVIDGGHPSEDPIDDGLSVVIRKTT